ncbi:hypothetical protein LTR56_002951 [Elasticomyces elasticus]|nr:hypothetical protein LTR22_014674 [Elasticomyces elasticus]KAK3656603.1 hypothetical protein LTR56_002951 [Elasticomyces elasticus]
MIGVVISWFCMSRFGRRTMYFCGLSAQFTVLLTIGFISLAHNNAASYATGSFLLLFTLCYDIAVGTVAYSIVTEIPSSRLRTKTTVLARAFYNCQGLINGVITPYVSGQMAVILGCWRQSLSGLIWISDQVAMQNCLSAATCVEQRANPYVQMLNPGKWNWSGKAGFFWAGTSFLCLTWVYFRLPEPKGRTYGELDILFEQKVSARRFAKAKVDPFNISYSMSEFVDVEEKRE